MNEHIFYVYGHYKKDTGELFYIGKGRDQRAWSTSDRNRHWHHIVKKHGYTVQLLHEHLAEDEALAKEIALIAEVGLDNLVNILPGGEGFTSDIARARWQDPENRQKMVEGLKKTFSDPEFRKRRSQQMKDIWKNPELRKKASEWMKGSKNGRGLAGHPDLILQMKQTRTTQWQDPTYRKKNLSARKRYMENGGRGPVANRKRNFLTGEYYLPNVPYPYTMQSSDGTIYRFTSLKEFRDTHKIPRQQLVRVLTGKRTEYMGWTAYQQKNLSAEFFAYTEDQPTIGKPENPL